ARDARRDDLVREEARDRGGAEPRLAPIGGEEAGEDVEESRLASAVRPDDRPELAARRAPFGPMIDRSSPRGTASDTPSTAASAPKCLARSSTSSSASPRGLGERSAGAAAGAPADGVVTPAPIGSRRARPKRRWKTPTMPLGENMTNAMKITPK